MSLSLITRKWAPTAMEYSKFLNRYGFETVCIITGRSYYGCIIDVYADEDEYLKISFENEVFNNEENQINELLKTIESLFLALLDDDYEEDEEEDFDEYEEVDDDIEQKGDTYFG